MAQEKAIETFQLIMYSTAWHGLRRTGARAVLASLKSHAVIRIRDMLRTYGNGALLAKHIPLYYTSVPGVGDACLCP